MSCGAGEGAGRDLNSLQTRPRAEPSTFTSEMSEERNHRGTLLTVKSQDKMQLV